MSDVHASIGRAFIDATTSQLDASTAKIKHCLAQIDQSQIWWQPTPTQNSIGNLILHLCGNLRQWIISGVGGAEDRRDRPNEFVPAQRFSKDALIEKLDQTVSDAKDALARCEISQLLQPRRIQGFETHALGAAFNSVAHFQGHTQEIISLTRQMLGDLYKFEWVPTTEEEISAGKESGA